MTTTRVTVNESIAQIAAADWNRLAGDDYPFLRHEFLLAAETSGSAAPETGWTTRHLTVRDADDSLRLSEFDSTIGEEGDLAPLTELRDVG